MNIPLEINVDIETLATAIGRLKREEAFEIIKAIDDYIAEYDFTEKLRDHFAEITEKEDKAMAQETT